MTRVCCRAVRCYSWRDLRAQQLRRRRYWDSVHHGHFHWGWRAHQNVCRRQLGPRGRRMPLGRIQGVARGSVRSRGRGLCNRIAVTNSGSGTVTRSGLRRLRAAGPLTHLAAAILRAPGRSNARSANRTGSRVVAYFYATSAPKRFTMSAWRGTPGVGRRRARGHVLPVMPPRGRSTRSTKRRRDGAEKAMGRQTGTGRIRTGRLGHQLGSLLAADRSTKRPTTSFTRARAYGSGRHRHPRRDP